MNKKIMTVVLLALSAGVASTAVSAAPIQANIVGVAPVSTTQGYLVDVAKTMTNPVTRYVREVTDMYRAIPFMGAHESNTGAEIAALEKTFD